jgi:hypothetical protein
MPSSFAHRSLLYYPNYLVLLVHYLLLFYSCLLSSLLLLLPTFLFLMEREDSATALFKRARARGCEKSKGIINGEEVREELQPITRKGYRRSLKLWQQSVKLLATSMG